MGTTNQDPRIAGNRAVSEAANAEAASSLLRAENERLHAHVQQLEEERAREGQALAALQAERDAYRRAAYAWALEQITDEDLQRYAQSEGGLPLDDLLGELEHSDQLRRDA